MTEKVALVTGAASGIGFAIATMLAEEGYALTVVSRRQQTLAPAAAALRSHGHDVLDIAADLSRDADLDLAMARHSEHFGRLDVLVNNAGMAITGPLAAQPLKHVDLQLQINLRSLLLLYRLAAESLTSAAAERGSSHVLNVSSIAGMAGAADLAAYSAAKHGVIGLTQAMNRELGPKGVKNTAICPGLVDTKLTNPRKTTVPAEQMIRPQDIAEGVRFLIKVSDYCVIPELVFLRPGLVE